MGLPPRPGIDTLRNETKCTCAPLAGAALRLFPTGHPLVPPSIVLIFTIPQHRRYQFNYRTTMNKCWKETWCLPLT